MLRRLLSTNVAGRDLNLASIRERTNNADALLELPAMSDSRTPVNGCPEF